MTCGVLTARSFLFISRLWEKVARALALSNNTIVSLMFHIHKLSSLVRRPPTGSDKTPPCRIPVAGARGDGVFATRTIRAGELIVAERPVYVSQRKFCPDGRKYGDADFYATALAGLSNQHCEAFLAL